MCKLRWITLMLLCSGCVGGSATGATQTPPPPPGPNGTVVTVTFDPSEATISAAHTATFTLVVRDAEGAQVIGAGVPTYTSNASSIATATNGTFSAHLPGVAVITATLKGVSGQATVTVVP